jgi:hypothetical protein
VTSIGIRPLEAAAPSVRRRLPRGLGLAAAALVSLALWAGLIRLALIAFGV